MMNSFNHWFCCFWTAGLSTVDVPVTDTPVRLGRSNEGLLKGLWNWVGFIPNPT